MMGISNVLKEFKVMIINITAQQTQETNGWTQWKFLKIVRKCKAEANTTEEYDNWMGIKPAYSMHGVGLTGQLYAKKSHWNTVSYHIQKWAQNGWNTKMQDPKL